MLDITYKAAWFKAHRIRFAIDKTASRSIDRHGRSRRTYIGGKEKNKHANKRTENNRGRSNNEDPVFALVERNGELRCQQGSKCNR